MLLKKKNKENLVLGLAGDVMIGRLVDEKLTHCKPGEIWGDLLPVLKACDFNIINFEGTLTHSKKKSRKAL